MTNAREVACYAVAHVIGFVLSALLTSFVMVQIYTSSPLAMHAGGRYMIAFIAFAVVQAVVFGIFVVMRGHPPVSR